MNMRLLLRPGLALGMAAVLLLSGNTVALAATTVRIMVVGDSITQGSAGDVTWRYRLAKHLSSAGVAANFVGDRDDLYDNINNVQGDHHYAYSFDDDHHAQWGRALADEKNTIGGAVSANTPDVVLVLLGINDLIWLARTPQQVAADMQAFVTNVRAAKPNATIVIGHTMSRWDLWNKVYLDQPATADLNSRYDTLAASMSTSSSRVVTTANPSGWDPAVHTWDGTHPNTTGETRIAKAFADALSKVGIGPLYTGPTSATWPQAGKGLTVAPLDKAAKLTWSSTPGANAYFIEQRIIVPSNETTFTRLPYPVSGTTWTAQAPAGWQIDYRIAPVKGLMTGLPGTSVRVTIGGKTPGTSWLSGGPGTTNNTQHLQWTAATNATGYYIETADLTQNPDTFSRLPYAVSGTSFDPGLLQAGHWYRWRVVPVNGLIEGPATNAVDIRTTGVPSYSNWYALGDSYSAGTGNQDSFGTTCLRSPTTWAYQAKAPWDPTPKLVACAGATTVGVRANQLGQIPWHAQGSTLVTMTIGGNDVGFADELQYCILGDTSCTTRESTINQAIDSLYTPLYTLYRDIRQRVPGADIYVSGYPQLVKAGTPCPYIINAKLSDAERYMITRLGARLNGVIRSAAANAGVFAFTDNVTSWFGSTHAACGEDPWINDYVISYLESSFHPFDPGNTAYAYGLNDRRVAVNTYGAARSPV